jgi:geranylgeranyl diphosphate synthase, type II
MAANDTERYLAARRELIEAALDRAVEADGSRLVDAMRYSLLGGGKRIRPILLLAAGEALGATPEPLLPFACGIEMIHTYSLVHDDLPAMDDDALRRGRPTSHARYGEALAILAGDALLTDAFAVMSAAALEHADPGAAIRVVHEIAVAAGGRGMVAGQAEDVAAAGGAADLAAVERIHLRKTGALLCAAVRSGAILGGAASGVLAGLTVYGDRLGLAFQIVDDVLDATAGSEVTGKIGGRDRILGKRTYAELLGVEGARARAFALRDEALRGLGELGAMADPLRDLADFVVARAAVD